MSKRRISLLMICKIAFTYVGAVIGAGFASGQEIFQFFTQYGLAGFFGMIIAGIFFSFGGIIILQLAAKLKVANYYQIFYKLLGKKIGFVIDLVYILLILGSISVMLAGSGTIFQETLGVRYAVGVIITLAVVIVIIFTGMRGIMIFNTVLIPILVIVIALTSLIHFEEIIPRLIEKIEVSSIMPWYISAIFYVSFNIFLSMALLTIIGAEIKERHTLRIGGALGGILLTIILILMGSVMYSYYGLVRDAEMPMLIIAGFSGKILYRAYLLSLWFAMITTAIAHVYSFIQRIIPLFKLSFYNSVMLTIVVVLPLTKFGFANLVKFLYPIYGIVAMSILFLMYVKQRMQKS